MFIFSRACLPEANSAVRQIYDKMLDTGSGIIAIDYEPYHVDIIEKYASAPVHPGLHGIPHGIPDGHVMEVGHHSESMEFMECPLEPEPEPAPAAESEV